MYFPFKNSIVVIIAYICTSSFLKIYILLSYSKDFHVNHLIEISLILEEARVEIITYILYVKKVRQREVQAFSWNHSVCWWPSKNWSHMCVSKSKISVCLVKTANPGQEESGLVGDEHRDFCSNVSCLQLVHKREDNSIKVGNDFAL